MVSSPSLPPSPSLSLSLSSLLFFFSLSVFALPVPAIVLPPFPIRRFLFFLLVLVLTLFSVKARSMLDEAIAVLFKCMSSANVKVSQSTFRVPFRVLERGAFLSSFPSPLPLLPPPLLSFSSPFLHVSLPSRPLQLLHRWLL